ncbi:prepilin-type N-terminal cleavage/methylation domain-containing protein [Neobacillus drentensis]|uniref:prepilin-type N-terminal cleavage/methylation domain-containing protein n=1 Tax=Neobacillus drentensis TaxID=220684 RepID=UPI00285DA717|nr:prepilin-type N-terminal cleavage/methylation domain-containing protein [Neobacillus drentensis]MDR7237405.1 type IV pilus assembly protein PilA [Neobacillus drentensis]
MVETLRLKLKEQKGFTLIELLAVIVILGIIAAIAIPAISSVISKSDAKSQAQEGLQIINAARMYVANEGGYTAPITRADLMEDYLDRVDSDQDFVVTLQDNASGVPTYYLFKHPSAGDIATPGISEQALIEAAK